MARYYYDGEWSRHRIVKVGWWMMVVIGSGPLTTTTTRAQFAATCSNARAVATAALIRLHTCPATDAVCSSGIVCEPDCLYRDDPSSISYSISCQDPCEYTAPGLDGYTVQRISAGSVAEGYYTYLSFSDFVDRFFLSVTHTFTDTSVAPGITLANIYEGTATTQGTIQARLGTTCDFKFNGNACVCTQVYCDAEKTQYGFTMDCSSLPGGSVISECVIPTLTADSSLLEILFYTPYLPRSCPDSSSTGSPPVAAPVLAATSPPPVVVTATGTNPTSPIVVDGTAGGVNTAPPPMVVTIAPITTPTTSTTTGTGTTGTTTPPVAAVVATAAAGGATNTSLLGGGGGRIFSGAHAVLTGSTSWWIQQLMTAATTGGLWLWPLL